jgi:hypothetical protein
VETFEAASANTRFAPALVDSGSNPNQAAHAVQRIAVAGLGHPSIGKMYLPNFSPCHEANPATCQLGGGAQSDFFTQIGPLTLTTTSLMEFDQAINTEDRFDGGTLEIKVGMPFTGNEATPYPDNVTVFDLGDYIIEGGYNSKLDGTLNGVPLSALLGRRSFSGVKPLHHVRVSLRSFAPGARHNPNSLPVFIRFRETSDAATSPGIDSGRFMDNLVVRNMGASGTVQVNQVASRKTHANTGTLDLPLALTGEHTTESRTGGQNGDHTIVFKFGAPITGVTGATVTGGTATVSSSGSGENSSEYVVNLTGVGNTQVVTVQLTGVSDACGNTTAAISASMGALLGDTNGDRTVNGGDAQDTRNRSGQPANTENLRADVNLDGAVNSGDAIVVRRQSGTTTTP